jgi:uncharacterized protein YcbX
VNIVAVVSALYVYPIKSCRGLELKSTRFDALGPLYDRRFMLVDEQGSFLTQRQEPRLALVTPRLAPTALAVTASGVPALKVPMSSRGQARRAVRVWSHAGEAEDAGEEAAAWFSQVLQRSCRLVRFPDNAVRWVDERYTPQPARVGFADAYPALLLSEEALADLNQRMETPVSMNRFRPNIVVKGAGPYAEDGWRRIRIGGLELAVVKPCARCAVVSVDQATAAIGKEPLATLASYRTRGNDALFGQNCVHLGPGSIRVGDEVEVLETA